MISIWQLDAALGLFFLASFVVDRFAWLNRKADWIEDTLFPKWLHYDTVGDFASWIQHGITSAIVAVLFACIALAVGVPFGVGFLHGACIMLAFYLIREGHQAYSHAREGGDLGPFVDRRAKRPGVHVGYLVDGLMDLTGPVVVWLSAWTI